MGIKTTITGAVADGIVEYKAGTWANARAGSGGAGFTLSHEDIYLSDAIKASYDAGANPGERFQVSRVFLYFDLSTLTIPDLAEVTGVRLKLYGYAYTTAEYASVQEGTQGDVLDSGDFNAYTGNMFAKNVFAWHGTGQNAFTFDQAGIDYIAGKIGETAKLCVREHDHEYLDAEPNDLFRSGIYFAEASGTDLKPELEIEYAYASPCTSKIEDAASGAGKDIRYSCLKGTGSWSDVISAAAADTATYAEQYETINDNSTGLDRFGISFDLSDLPVGVEFTAATLNLYIEFNHDQADEDTIIAALVRSNHDPDSQGVDDYNNSQDTVFASIGPLADNDSGWKSAVLNSSGLQAINDMFANESKILRFFIRDKHHDIDGNTPADSGWSPEMAWWARQDAEGYSPDRVMNLELTFTVNNQTDCETMGWYWYDNACHQDLPDTQEACEASGNYWWASKCHSELPDTEKECSGYAFYWYYGECQLTNKLGVIPCVCIDTVENIWLAAGHEVKEIAEIFVTPTGGSGEPRLRTTGFETYPAYVYAGGLDGKIAVIQFTADPPEETDSVWCNVKGMMDDTGNLIENPIEILQNFITKYIGMTAGQDYEEIAFNTAKAVADTMAYKSAGAIIDHPSAQEVIEKMAASIGAKIFFNQGGRLCVKFLD